MKQTDALNSLVSMAVKKLFRPVEMFMHVYAKIRDNTYINIGFPNICIFDIRLGIRVFILYDIDDVAVVFGDSGKVFTKNRDPISDLFFKRSLTMMNGDSHHCLKGILAPLFSSSFITDNYLDAIVSIAKSHTDSWSAEGLVDLEKALNRLFIDISIQVVLGVKDETSRRALQAAIENISSATEAKYNHWTAAILPIWIPVTPHIRLRHAQDEIISILKKIILTRDTNPAIITAFEEYLTKCNVDKNSHLDFLIDNYTLLLFAAYITTTKTFKAYLNILFSHPDVLDLVTQEVLACHDENSPKNKYSNMIITGNVLREVARLYPPLWVAIRKAVVLTELPSGVKIQPNDMVIISRYHLQRFNHYEPNSHKFTFERYQTTTSDLRKIDYSFGAGKKKCLGAKLFEFECVLLTEILVRNYEIGLQECNDKETYNYVLDSGYQAHIQLHKKNL